MALENLWRKKTLYEVAEYEPNMFNREHLKRAVSLSDNMIIGLNVKHPNEDSVLVATDKFWSTFGPETGADLIRRLREKHSCAKRYTRREVLEINRELFRYLN